jgi:hypothetical protein
MNGIYSPFVYPWFCITYFLTVHVLASICSIALGWSFFGRTSEVFRGLATDKKRNVITYIIQFLMTTMACILQIWGGVDILFNFADTTPPYRLDWLSFAFQTIVVLYVWELIYREKIGIPLLIHHLVTILLIQLASASFYDTYDVVYLRFGTLLGFYATTEQLSFVVLFLYRLKLYPKSHSTLFLVAGALAFIIKTGITIFGLAYYGWMMVNETIVYQNTNWNWFWSVCFVPLVVLLYFAQFYSCKILWNLHLKCKRSVAVERQPDTKEENPNSLQDSATSSNTKESTNSVQDSTMMNDEVEKIDFTNNDLSNRNDDDIENQGQSPLDFDLESEHDHDEAILA